MSLSNKFHTHYHTVVSISSAFSEMLQGYLLCDAFSLNRNEFVAIFQKDAEYLSIRLLIEARSGFIFVSEGKFERTGSVYLLFQSLIGKEILSVQQHPNNRSFAFCFDENLDLVFKLYGGLSNVIFFGQGEPIEAFRTSIENDLTQPLSSLHQSQNKYEELVPSKFFVFKQDENLLFSYDVQSNSELQFESDNVFEALNYFGRNYLSQWHFKQRKECLLSQLNAEKKRLLSQQLNTEKALGQHEKQLKYDEIANIIMANLHELQIGLSKSELFDFYRNQNIVIKLKKDLNPQQNAAEYYRKSKNQNIEIDLLYKRLDEIQQKLINTDKQIVKVESATSSKDLKEGKNNLPTDKATESPFKNFSFEGFTILVGKNAENNDKLTLKFANKNDMWLHAKDVTGSHVVIRYRQGKPFTKPLITYAAQLAAYYSKAKSSTLVPVVYTLKKFVRKPKGAIAGTVTYENGETILVEPSL
jgi:predicted ribosome quality control (RQC) complex YloA/Tae2 family protein